VADRVVNLAQAVAARRAQGMPFAYAVGRAAFRHLTLRVDERVLIPRQETELLVELVLARCPDVGGVVADVGTGSGAIAIALASEGRFDRVIATDVAADAVELARENAMVLDSRSTAHMEFRVGDLLNPLRGERLDVLVSNPPYIAYDEAAGLPPSVRDWEPVHALLTGSQGMDASRKLVDGAPSLVCSGGLLALEVDVRRALQVAELVASAGTWRDVQVIQDLAGRDRFVLATRA
jgi:release factor glutamine methyltransferase